MPTLGDVGIGGYVGGVQIQVMASAGVISPTSRYIRVTGVVPINTITRLGNFFTGPIYLFSTDATPTTITAAGNVALAVTLVRYRVCSLIYDPATSKWYPSYTT